MARDTFKDIELAGKRWRVQKVDALTGSNILRRYISSGFSDPVQFIGSLPDDVFSDVQKSVLMYCKQLVGKDNAPLTVMLPDGRMGVDEVSGDILYMLTMAALSFNLSGFFDERTLTEYQAINQGLISSNVPI